MTRQPRLPPQATHRAGTASARVCMSTTARIASPQSITPGEYLAYTFGMNAASLINRRR
jgi:hypothetical protein